MTKHKQGRNKHGWTTRTADGRRRYVEARLFGAAWTLTSRCADEEEWTVHDPPLLEDLEALHEVLFNKYQRKHLAWEHLATVKRLIEAHGHDGEHGAASPASGEGEDG